MCLIACGCTGWPLAAYVLIGRDDIAATVQASVALPPEGATPQSSVPLASPVSSLALGVGHPPKGPPLAGPQSGNPNLVPYKVGRITMLLC